MNERAKLIELFPRASPDFIHANVSRVSDAEPKRDAEKALDSATQAENRGLERVTVRFTRHCVRPLDPDNYIGGLKHCIDALRAAHLLRDDDPASIKIEAEQVKISHYADEKTVVKLIYP